VRAFGTGLARKRCSKASSVGFADRDFEQPARPVYRSMPVFCLLPQILIQILPTIKHVEPIQYLLRFYSGLLLQIIGKLNSALAGV